MLIRLLGFSLVLIAPSSWLGAETSASRLPVGSVLEGVVNDDGSATLFVLGERDSFLVDVTRTGVHTESQPTSTARIEFLSDGSLLVMSREEPRDAKGNLAVVYRMVERRDNGKKTAWEWNSLDFIRQPTSHVPAFSLSPDGRTWGTWGFGSTDATEFVFGRRRSGRARARDTRVEVADLGDRDLAVSESKWPVAPDFVFLDSDGPVVLVPWSGGAYVLHFASNGSSPYTVPILFEGGVEEYAFRWQWKERVLWARTSLYWKAYNLWDLGLSSMREEPFLVVEKSAEPHPQRGAVRLATQEGRYRVEHLWRDPWAPAQETHVSEWRSGRPAAFFVSPSGRHALVLETRESEEGESRTYAQLVELALTQPIPLVEPDLEAEIAADQAVMPWLKAPPRKGREEPEAAVEGRGRASKPNLEVPEAETPTAERSEPPGPAAGGLVVDSTS